MSPKCSITWNIKIVKMKTEKIKKAYFVSGTDTDAGKTYATGVLAAALQCEGKKVITQKFIQTGCEENEISEDIKKHRKLMGIELQPEDLDHTTAPLRYKYPASPDLAASLEERIVDLSLVEQSTKKLLEKYNIVLIEGAGGLMVPLIGFYTTLDYIKQHDLALIFVTNPKLGSVNHTLLSLEVCRQHNVRVSMIVYNHYPMSSDVIAEDTRLYLMDYIDHYLPGCDFVEIPFVESADKLL